MRQEIYDFISTVRIRECSVRDQMSLLSTMQAMAAIVPDVELAAE